MLILLYGQDTYRSRQKLKEIIEQYKKIHKSGLNFKFFEGGPVGKSTASYGAGNLSFEDFKGEIFTSSMFAEKKLFILENIFSNEEFKENFLKNSKKFILSHNLILFYEDKEISEADKLLKLIKKYGKVQKFEFLKGKILRNWIEKEIEQYNTIVTPEIIEKLINFVGSDSWQLSNEIKKLVSYCKNKVIKEKDIELLIKPKIETDIFKTIDAIASKNKKQALELLHKHLEKGDPPLYLLSMINFQFRNLLMVKSYQLRDSFNANYGNLRILSGKLGLHPFVIKKSIEQAKKFSLEELKKIYQKIFQADLDIKTGRLDPQTALDLLITEI